jgi:hypothetical protein
MDTDLPTRVQQIAPTDLIVPLRKQQNSPNFEILDWTVQPIGHERIISTTGGLFCLFGHGRDEVSTREWSLVLKILNKPFGYCLDPTDWCYWKRELDACNSGLFATLPAGVRAPLSYGTVEYDDSAWIWMERIVETTGRIWLMDDYQRAARISGRSAGAYLMGHPLPTHDWFPQFFRNILANGGRWATRMDPQILGNVWEDPLVQEHFGEPLRSQILNIWHDREAFFNVFDHLPQVLSHNDFHRRNLMLQRDATGQDELIAVDWSFTGLGAVGSDMGELIASSMYFNEIDPEQAEFLESTVMEAYIAGLNDSDWRGDSRIPRLGYLLSASFWMGATLPGWTEFMQREQINEEAMYGYPADQLVLKWVILCEFLMARADEARQLIETLGLD